MRAKSERRPHRKRKAKLASDGRQLARNGKTATNVDAPGGVYPQGPDAARVRDLAMPIDTISTDRAAAWAGHKPSLYFSKRHAGHLGRNSPTMRREIMKIMAPTSGGSGDGDEIGAVLCLGGRERLHLYSGSSCNSINLWLSMANRRL
jgi:hypothetical protein